MKSLLHYQLNFGDSKLKTIFTKWLLLLCLIFANTSFGQKVAANSGNWSSPGTWSPSGVPTSAQTVTIAAGRTVTVDITNAACSSLQLGGTSANTFGILTFAATGNPKLTVTGATNVGGNSGSGNNNRRGEIDLVSGATLETGSMVLTVGSGNSPAILAMDSGCLLKTGSFTNGGGTITYTSGGTVDMTATNTLPALFTSFEDLTISSGTTKLGANTTISGTLNLTGNLDVNAFTGFAGEITGNGNLTNTGAAKIFTIGSSNTNTTYSGVISATTAANLAITKTGTGTLTLSGNNTYTGATTISGGKLELGAADRIANASPFTFNGGTFSTGATTGFSETIGVATLSANSTIDLGIGVHTLTIANSSAATWGAFVLTVNGWTGTGGSSGGGTAGKIQVGVGGIGVTQLAKIQFTGYPIGAVITASGELVPSRNIFYSKGSLAPDTAANWNTKRDGSGTNAVAGDFTGGNYFIIQNGHSMTTGGAWSVSGTSSLIQIENGGTLIATSAITLAAATTFQIDNGGTYKHQNTTAYATSIFQAGTKSFGTSSTVELNNSNTTGPTGVTFGNLIINFTADPGGTVQFNAGVTTINGNFTIQNTNVRQVALTSTTFTLNISGDLIVSGGTLNVSSGAGVATINVGGDFTHTGGTITESSTGSGTILINGSGAQTIESTGLTNTVNFTVAPTGAGTVEIAAGKTFVDSGSSVFTISNTSSGTELTVNGTLNRSSSADIVRTGALVVGATGTYQHAYNGGGAIPTATWNLTSTCNVTGVVATVPTTGSFAQTFGNFTWNCASQTGDLSLAGNLTDVAGNFTVTNTNTGSVRLSNGGVTDTFAIGGNFSQTGGEFYIGGTSSSNTWTVNIAGNFSLTGGTLDLNGNSGATTINVSDNFAHTGGTITESGSATNTINIIGSSAKTLESIGLTNTINFTIAPTSAGTVQIATGKSFTGGSGAISVSNTSSAAEFTNNGTLVISSSLVGAGSFVNTGTFNSSGTISVTSLSNSGTISHSGTGTITTALANFINTGTLNISGSGTITGITNNAAGIVNHSGSSTVTSFNNATSTSILNINTTPTVPTFGTLTVSASGNTVNYTGAGTQAIKAVAYNNLILSGSGAKSILAGTSVTGTLSIAPTGSATASIAAGQNIPVGTLLLAGVNTVNGTWGYGPASPPFNKNQTYFANTTGYVTVSNGLTFKSQIISANLGSASWCQGETRNITVTIKNIGTATWTDGTGGTPTINIGVKWNTNGTSWDDYKIRTTAANLAPGDTDTYTLPLTASDYVSSYGSPLAIGSNNITFDVVQEAVSWFGNNGGGVGPGNTVFTSATQNILGVISTTGNSKTYTGTTNATTVSATTSAGTTIDWYDAATGGNLLASGTLTYAPIAINAGTYTVYAEARNTTSGCTSATRTSATLTINAATLTVTANTATHVYGSPLTPGPGATPLSITGMQNSETLTGTVTLAYTSGNATNSGVTTYSGAVSPSAFVKASGTANLSNYTINYVTNTLTVTAATLTVTANTRTHAYGATLTPGAGATPLSVTGMQNSETLTGTVTLAYTSGNTAGSAVGTYTGAVSPSTFVKTSGSAALANYTVTYVTNDLFVTAATLTVTANTATHVYGSPLTPGPGATPLSVTGMLNSETLAGTVTLAYASGNATNSGVTTYAGSVSPSAFVKVSGTANLSNYTINYVTNTLTVTAATLTVTANTATHVYGATLTPGAGAIPLSITGMQNSETLVGTVTLAYTSGNTAGSAVGTYTGAISPNTFVKTSGSAALANYTITYVTNDLFVTAATLTVTANTATHVYGTTLTPGSGATPLSVTGMKNSETLVGTVTLAYTSGNTESSAVGTYTGAVSPSVFVKTSGTANLSNYTINYITNNLTVTAATLTVTANTAAHIYGATLTPGAGATPLSVTGMQNSETLVGTVTLAYTSGNATTSVVGTYSGAVSPSAFVQTSGTVTLSNYTINYVTNNLTVTAAILTVNANTATHVYGTTLTPGAGATPQSITGMQNSETLTGTVSLAYTIGNTATSAVGTYTGAVSPSAFVKTGGSATLSNYTINYVTNDLIVTAAPLTITANDVSKCFGTTHSLGTSAFTPTGLVLGETVGSVTLTSLGDSSGAAVGTYSIVPSAATGGTFTASNYSITYNDGTLTVVATNTAGTASSTPTLCINTALTTITHTTTGAAGIGAATGLPSGVTAGWASNTITISGTPTASGTFNYTIPLTGGCGSVSAAGTIIVTPTVGAPGFISGATTVCQDAANETYTATATNTTGITYTVSPAEAGTIDSLTGIMNWSAAFSGTATITASAAGCSGPNTFDRVVTVNPSPIVTALDASGCAGSSIVLSGSATPSGGSGIYSVANPYVGTSSTTYTYTYTDLNGCSATSAPANIIITPQPLWYLDADGDHYYTGAIIPSCTSPGAGYTTSVLGGNDCNDSNTDINPGATEICYNNVDDNCDLALSEGCAPVVVNMTPSYNNSTLTSLATAISAAIYTYPGTTNIKYRFSITNVTTGITAADIIQASRFVTIPAEIHLYNATYTIKASAVINDEVVAFAGNTITVSSPRIQEIKLSPASCGSTLASLTTTIAANAGLNAIGYTFRIRLNSDNSPSPTYGYSQSASRFVSANSFTGFPLQYSSIYKVAVQYTSIDPVTNLPVDSGYGTECLIMTSSIPLTGIASPTQGAQVSAINAGITATSAPYAIAYQFRIRLFSDNGPTPTYHYSTEVASRFSSLTAFGIQLAYNTEYVVSVRYSVAGPVWSEYGPDRKFKTPFFPVTNLITSQCGLETPTSLTQQLNIVPYPGYPNYKVLLEEVDGEDVLNSQEIVVAYSHFRLNQFSIAQLGKNYSVSVAIKLNGVFGPYETACDLLTPDPGKNEIIVPFKAKAYPNPFANNFMLDVRTTSQSSVNLKVYDMIGRLVEQRNVSVSDMETITMGDRYPSGVYNIIVSQENNVETVRVVKR